VVAIVVHAPLHVDHLPGGVGDDGLRAPAVGREVVVNADTGVEAAGAASADGCYIEIRPGGDGLKNRAFGARVDTRLNPLARCYSQIRQR
jgi:hypothetical protein